MKIRYLDGLRGVAAVVVVIEHLSALLPLGDATLGQGVLGQVATSAINFPFRAGNFSVYIFFAISGIVIAGSASRRPTWPLIVARRYLRLTLPMLIATISAWILLYFFPDELPRIAAFRPNHWTTEIYQAGAPSFLVATQEAVWSAYVYGTSYCDPVLWSMRSELFGSLGIYTFYRFVPREQRLAMLWAAVVILAATGMASYLAFPLGAILNEMNVRGRPRTSLGWAVTIGLSSLGFAVIGTTAVARYVGGRVLGILPMPMAELPLVNSIAATMMLFSLINIPSVQKAFSSHFPRFLGRISYSLYLLHMPLLYTIFAELYLRIGEPPSGGWLVAWTLLFLMCSVVAAWAMTVWIDGPATRLADIGKPRTTTEVTRAS